MTQAPALPLYLGRSAASFDAGVAVRHLGRADQRLAGLIARVGPCTLRPDRKATPFAALAQSIIYQQLSGRAAATIFGRVRALAEGGPLTPELLLQATDEALRACGVSGSKARSLRDLAAKALDGTVPTRRAMSRMTDEEIIERLRAVRGVGRWTAQMLLIFRLGRPDVLPADDLGVRKGYALTFGKRALPDPRRLLSHGERWRPYRSVASWYFWRANEL